MSIFSIFRWSGSAKQTRECVRVRLIPVNELRSMILKIESFWLFKMSVILILGQWIKNDLVVKILNLKDFLTNKPVRAGLPSTLFRWSPNPRTLLSFCRPYALFPFAGPENVWMRRDQKDINEPQDAFGSLSSFLRRSWRFHFRIAACDRLHTAFWSTTGARLAVLNNLGPIKSASRTSELLWRPQLVV